MCQKQSWVWSCIGLTQLRLCHKCADALAVIIEVIPEERYTRILRGRSVPSLKARIRRER